MPRPVASVGCEPIVCKPRPLTRCTKPAYSVPCAWVQVPPWALDPLYPNLDTVPHGPDYRNLLGPWTCFIQAWIQCNMCLDTLPYALRYRFVRGPWARCIKPGYSVPCAWLQVPPWALDPRYGSWDTVPHVSEAAGSLSPAVCSSSQNMTKCDELKETLADSSD